MREPIFAGVPKSALEAECGYYDTAALECDGLSRVLSALLTLRKVPFEVYCGDLIYRDKLAAPLHLWIELADSTGRYWYLDLRARMWCLELEPGQSVVNVPEAKNIPHGIIDPERFPLVEYGRHGTNKIELPNLPVALIRFMVAPLLFPPPDR